MRLSFHVPKGGFFAGRHTGRPLRRQKKLAPFHFPLSRKIPLRSFFLPLRFEAISLDFKSGLFYRSRRGGPAWPPGKATSSGPPGHLPLRGEGFCSAPFKPPPYQCLPCVRGGGSAVGGDGGVAIAAQRNQERQSLSLANARQLPLHKGAFLRAATQGGPYASILVGP